mgnify:CR=1 FL=1
MTGRLPAVRKVKQPHGEASTYVATIHSAAGHVCKLDFGYGRNEDEANARLFAAAPELLEALKFAIAVDTEFHEGHAPMRTPEYQESYDKALAAIAKAEGGRDA